jgi:hypothetical protein
MEETRTPGDIPGMIEKAASLAAQDVTEEDLKAINKHALTPLKAEEVFTFRAVLCDNDLDRQYERFNLKGLQDMQKLFLGKTVIKDHIRSADNQVARIYATELEQGTKTTETGELYTRLLAKCYMVKTAGNADLIAEIKGGIKKEGSVGFSPSSAICSICGTDNAKSYCAHWRGRSYDKEGGKTVCTFTLAGVKDAYEFSLVAVPAQKAAGVSKSYTGETVYYKAEEPQPEETQNEKDAEKVKELELRARLIAAKAQK